MNDSSMLVINADDLGMGKEKTMGILIAAERKLIQSASMCVTSLETEPFVQQIFALSKQIPIGLHINLTEGHPFRSALGLLSSEDSLDTRALESEISHQVKKFAHFMGHTPSHMDCHQHFTYLSPKAFRAFLNVARKHRIPIRSALPFINEERLKKFSVSVFERYKITLPFDPTMRAQALSAVFNEVKAHTRTQDVIIDFDFNKDSLPSEHVEVVCHPHLTEAGVFTL